MAACAQTNDYTYDAENRLISVGGSVSYVYDGEGRRIRKTVSGTSVDFLYDLGINVVAEMSSTGSWNRGEVYAGGRHIATYNQGTTFFNHGDWLGTERARTGVSGPVSETCSSLPFGDGQSCSGNETTPNHFTGKERDTESNLDYFGARYYGSTMGRFLSPDEFAGGPVSAFGGDSAPPGPLPYADITNPQSLNKYGYTYNNPLRFIDPSGHTCVDPLTAIVCVAVGRATDSWLHLWAAVTSCTSSTALSTRRVRFMRSRERSGLRKNLIRHRCA